MKTTLISFYVRFRLVELEEHVWRPRLKAFETNRFRPTYPGFRVEVGGVEELRAALFERKPPARSLLVLRSRKSGRRWCEHGAPVWICGTLEGLEGKACGAGIEPQKRSHTPHHHLERR